MRGGPVAVRRPTGVDGDRMRRLAGVEAEEGGGAAVGLLGRLGFGPVGLKLFLKTISP